MDTSTISIAPEPAHVNRSTSNDTAAAAPPSPRPSESETLTDEDRWTLRHARQERAEREAFPELVDLDEARSNLHAGLVSLCRVASAATCDEGVETRDHVSRGIVATMSALSLVADGIDDAWKRANDRRLDARDAKADPYPSRAAIVRAARRRGFDTEAIALLEAMDVAGDRDPGPDFWLSQLKAWRLRLATFEAHDALETDEPSPPSSPAVSAPGGVS